MSKTAETVSIEKALYKFSKASGLGIYGCFEVSAKSSGVINS